MMYVNELFPQVATCILAIPHWIIFPGGNILLWVILDIVHAGMVLAVSEQ